MASPRLRVHVLSFDYRNKIIKKNFNHSKDYENSNGNKISQVEEWKKLHTHSHTSGNSIKKKNQAEWSKCLKSYMIRYFLRGLFYD